MVNFFPGAQTALFGMLMTVVGPGDGLIVPEPYYAPYTQVLGATGVEVGHIGAIDGKARRVDRIGARLYDATIVRSFVPSSLRRDLRPFVQLSGPLAALDQSVPGFAECLVSGVSQVFGMMMGLELSIVDECPWADGGDACATVDVDLLEQQRLSVELRLPHRHLSESRVDPRVRVREK